MATLVTRVAVTPYLLRLQLAFDGVAPEVVTLTNAQLTDLVGPFSMVRGPLYDLWHVSGFTTPQLVDRCLLGPRAEIVQFVRDSFPGFGIDVTADLNGAPQLIVNFPIKDVPITAVISLKFRHTYDR